MFPAEFAARVCSFNGFRQSSGHLCVAEVRFQIFTGRMDCVRGCRSPTPSLNFLQIGKKPASVVQFGTDGNFTARGVDLCSGHRPTRTGMDGWAVGYFDFSRLKRAWLPRDSSPQAETASHPWLPKLLSSYSLALISNSMPREIGNTWYSH
jgi:hypothetical protein